MIEPLFEPEFSRHSYGYRPGRSAHSAIRHLESYLASGNYWVVCLDIADFFETVDHAILLDFITQKVNCPGVFRLIKQWLKAGVMEEGSVRTQVAGTPQGGVISPLLSNIYLDRLDKVLERAGVLHVRYADDVIIVAKKHAHAHRARKLAARYLRKSLKLKVAKDKTTVTHLLKEGFEFLGYRFKGRYKRPTDEAIKVFKEKVRRITRRRQPVKLSKIIANLNPVIRGWGNYFRYGQTKRRFEDLDGWIRMRLRSFLLKKKAIPSRNWRYPSCIFASAGLVALSTLLQPSVPLELW